jgi:hypothetical protein
MEDASASKTTRTSKKVEFEQCSSGFHAIRRNVATQPAIGAGRRRLKWEPARSTLWLHRTSLNSTPHRANTGEEQSIPAIFLAATPSADFNHSRPAIAINSRPVRAKASPQASYNASGVFTVRDNKKNTIFSEVLRVSVVAPPPTLFKPKIICLFPSYSRY